MGHHNESGVGAAQARDWATPHPEKKIHKQQNKTHTNTMPKERLPRVSTTLGLAAPAAEADGRGGGVGPAAKEARPTDGADGPLAPLRAALAGFAAVARADAGLAGSPAGTALR